jgi:hypothetical protein
LIVQDTPYVFAPWRSWLSSSIYGVGSTTLHSKRCSWDLTFRHEVIVKIDMLEQMDMSMVDRAVYQISSPASEEDCEYAFRLH